MEFQVNHEASVIDIAEHIPNVPGVVNHVWKKIIHFPHKADFKCVQCNFALDNDLLITALNKMVELLFICLFR